MKINKSNFFKSKKGNADIETIMFLLIAFAIVIVTSAIIGASSGKDSCRKAAIDNNCAKYIVNPTNGETTFVWYNNTNKW
jgi:hypothetical protein